MRISVVIPCFNAEPYLAQTLGSALSQTREAEEIIVVDDGSSDGSREIAQSFGRRVRLVSQPNSGACRARNEGARRAAGDALLFLDSDDVLDPDALAGLAAALEGRTAAIAACRWRRLEQAGGEWRIRPASCMPRRAVQHPLCSWLEGWYHPPCSLLWSRAAFRMAGGWDEAAIVNQDGLLMMRAMAAGVPLTMASFGCAYYRRQPKDRVSVSGRRMSPEGLASRFRVLELVAASLGPRAAAAPFAASLAFAYDTVSHDCLGRFPDLERACAERAARYGGPQWRRALHAAWVHWAGKARRCSARVAALSQGGGDSRDEARFGLEWAAGVAEARNAGSRGP